MKGKSIAILASLAGAALLTGSIASASPAARPANLAALAASTPIAAAAPFDAANFVNVVDNPYFPLTPGTTYIFEGQKDGISTRDVVEVMSDTKDVLGVASTVVHDSVYEEGELTEETWDWYAQDKDGNVWYMGEASQTFENGVVQGTEGSWEGGVYGAIPGIIMLAQPVPGDPYQQEYLAGIAEDLGQVIANDEQVSIGYGDFDRVVVTKDFSPLEPEVIEHKSYAPGIGLILAESVQGENERMELVEIQTGAATPTTSG